MQDTIHCSMRKTIATFLSAQLIGLIESSMAVMAWGSAPALSFENGEVRRVKINHANGNITATVGAASNIERNGHGC